jgi:zinc transporter 2
MSPVTSEVTSLLGGGGSNAKNGGLNKRRATGSPSSSPKSPLNLEREAEFDKARREKKLKNKRAAKALTGAIIFCFCFMIAEGVGGMLSHSLAILTDAAHMLTDVAALSLALFALHASSRPASEHYSFGWQRAEAVGALASVFTIWALVGAITVEAVERIVGDVKCAQDKQKSDCEGVDAVVMFGIGCGGLLANFCCAAILAWGGHSHSHGGSGSHGHSHGVSEQSHGHSHGGGGDAEAGGGSSHGHAHGGVASDHEEDPEEAKAKKEKAAKNLNVRGAFLHALGDCIQSAGVIIAAGVIWGYNHYTFGTPSAAHSWANLADPCCSIVFGIITLYTTMSLFKDLLKILMQGTPTGVEYAKVMDTLFAIDGVESVHDLHIWSLTSENVVLSVHLVADHHHGPAILCKAQEVLDKEFGISHTTIQIDSPDVNASKCSALTFQCAN